MSSNPRPHSVTPTPATDDRLPWAALEALSHRDPGGRGLVSYRRADQSLDAGALCAASHHLAEHARSVVIATGFPIVFTDRVVAETDGPPGTLCLAVVLQSLGVTVKIVTDAYALPVLHAGAECLGLDSTTIQACPASGAECEAWLDGFISGVGADWSHLIAIERPGPSHTLQSFRTQRRDTPIPVETFESTVSEADRDRCYNMRGEPLEAYMAPTHRLFERIVERELPIRTIAIGDGGNELGLGCFLWEDLVAAIATGSAGKIACRVAANITILAGTSNWGAYALALAVARLRGLSLSQPWLTPAGQQRLLEAIVAAGAVDGRTRRAEPTVDGLSAEDYLQTLAEMRDLLKQASR